MDRVKEIAQALFGVQKMSAHDHKDPESLGHIDKQ